MKTKASTLVYPERVEGLSLKKKVFKKLIDVTLSAVEVINLKKLQIIIYFVFIMTRITTLR